MWEYQVELNQGQTKTIWLLNSTYSTAFSTNIVEVDLGVFPPVALTPTPTRTSTPTPSSSVDDVGNVLNDLVINDSNDSGPIISNDVLQNNQNSKKQWQKIQKYTSYSCVKSLGNS
jgi:hypothetical protein